MYEEFFEMTHTPFVRGIPVDNLYEDQDTEEVYNRLLYAASRQLFALVVGDAGTGKTTALRRLKSVLDGQDYTVLYLSESKLTPRHFYNGLLEQLGCETRFYRGDARNLLHHEIEIMRGVGHRKLVVIVLLEDKYSRCHLCYLREGILRKFDLPAWGEYTKLPD